MPQRVAGLYRRDDDMAVVRTDYPDAFRRQILAHELVTRGTAG
jgi:hypothetical protein